LKPYFTHSFFFFLKDFIYLFDRESTHEFEEGGGAEEEGDADSSLSRESDLGSIPGP